MAKTSTHSKWLKKSINVDITFGYVSLHFGCVIYQNPPLLPRVSLQWADLHIVCHAQPVTKKRMSEKMLLRLEPQWIIGWRLIIRQDHAVHLR